MRRIKNIDPFIILLALLAMYCGANAQQYWIEQACPTTKSLVRLTFKDTLNGWAVGDSGIIVHTSDGGLNWGIQQSSIITGIEDVFFIDINTGYALANDYSSSGTIVLRTTNGGMNWTNSRFTDTTLILKSVYFLNASTGFMGGISPTVPAIMRTTNGGASWQKATIHFALCYDYPILRFNFFNALSGYAVGGFFDRAGITWQTTDGGLNWSDSCIAAEPMFDIYPVNDTYILATGGDPEYGTYVYSTTNSGTSWSGLSLNMAGIGQRIAPRTNGEFWIPCGSIGKFAVSLDTGVSWFPIDIQDSIRAYDASFPSQYSGWGVGNKGYNYRGAIIKYNSSVIGLQNEQTGVPYSPVLSQNYPNPFNPSTLIKYYLPAASNVKLTVFDLLGKKMEVLDEGMKKAGEHTVEFNGNKYSSGVYFYQLQAVTGSRQYSLNKKMVLIK